MQFDSNRAWREATAMANANRDVLLAVAGVFFLLPGFASVLFLSDFQADMMANFGNPAAAERIMAGMTGPVVAFGLVSFLLQSLGYLAMLALLTDKARPTVAQAISGAVKALPTLIGAALLFFGGYLMAVLIFTLFAGAIGAISGLAALAAVLVVVLIAGMVYVMIKLSLILPVIVVEGLRNPMAALLRSWQLTKGNSLRLFVFYLLLTIAYFVLTIVITIVAMAPVALIAGQGKVSLVFGGLLSGIIGAAASALLTAIFASIHRQLVGPTPEKLGSNFD